MKLFGYQLPGMSSLILWGLLWEACGQLEVVTRRPHRGGHGGAVEADLHGFLDDEVVGPAHLPRTVEVDGEDLLGAAPSHHSTRSSRAVRWPVIGSPTAAMASS